MTVNKYWAAMSAEQRSAEMKRRRAKSKRPAGGYHYVDKSKVSEYGKLGANKRWSNNAPVAAETEDAAAGQEPAAV